MSNKQNTQNTQNTQNAQSAQQNIINTQKMSSNQSAANSRIIGKIFDFLVFIGKRSASSVLVLTLIAVVLFLIFFMLPANPAQLACGKPCTPERLARVSAFMGTDAPWYEQLGNYIRGIFLDENLELILHSQEFQQLVLPVLLVLLLVPVLQLSARLHA